MNQATQTGAPNQLNAYQQFFVATHPAVKAAHPDWTPQQVTTEIGQRWSLQNMTLTKGTDSVTLKHTTKSIRLPACGQVDFLFSYLDSYRSLNGHKALLALVERMREPDAA